MEFYKESNGGRPEYVGDGILEAGTSPARYRLAYPAARHGAAGDVRTYFANCIARSTEDGTKKVPSYSRPVRIRRRFRAAEFVRLFTTKARRVHVFAVNWLPAGPGAR